MKTLTHKLLATVFSCISLYGITSIKVNAQIPNNMPVAGSSEASQPISVQSPNVASLGLYNEVGVSLFNGLPKVEVPLYEIKSKSLTIPLSLSYHASGVRPDVHPSWVGMGWNLNAGGAIYRVAHGNEDELNDNQFTWGDNAGFYFHNQAVQQGVPYFDIQQWDNKSYATQTVNAPSSNVRDSEPDEFSFNFLGYSGKFYWNPTSNSNQGAWQVKCDRPIQVSLSSTTPFLASPFIQRGITTPGHYFPASFGGFVITGEDGIQYTFGTTTNAIEYGIRFFNQQGAYWVANSWQLVKITHPDGSQVTLNYERENGKYINQMSISILEYMGIVEASSDTPMQWLFNPSLSPTGCGGFSFNSDITHYNEGSLISPVYLSSIQTPSSTIYFDRIISNELSYPQSVYQTKYQEYINTSPRPSYFLNILQNNNLVGSTSIPYPDCLSSLVWHKLDKVRVLSAGTTLKQFDFVYANTSSERLKLGAVNEAGKRGYQFTYFDQYNSIYNPTGPIYERLPDYLANKNDHWGFFNNTFAQHLSSSYYADRQASTDPKIYESNMLSSMVYPTGGCVAFEYEQHTYRKQLAIQQAYSSSITTNSHTRLETMPNNVVAGGLRIKRITTYKTANYYTYPQNYQDRLSSKEYFYVSGYTPGANLSTLPSSGILAAPVQYTFSDYRNFRNGSQSVSFHRDVFSSSSLIPASSNSAGAHVTYSEVVERNTLIDNGYTKYFYTNYDNGRLDENPDIRFNDISPYEPFNSTDEERGKLLREQSFSSNPNLTTPIRERVIDYTSLNKGTEWVRGLKLDSYAICPGFGDFYLEGAAYKRYTYSYLPVHETLTVRDVNAANPIVTEKYYAYNNKRLLSSETTLDSKGGYWNTAHRYVSDADLFPPTTYPLAPDALGIFSRRLTNILVPPVETIQSYNGKVTGATLNVHRNIDGQLTTMPYQTFNFETDSPISNYTYLYYAPFYDISTAATKTGLVYDTRNKLKTTFSAYNTSRNLTDYAVANSPTQSFQWGYKQELLTATFTNASRAKQANLPVAIGNEASFLGFETGVASEGTSPDEDYWAMGGGNSANVISTTAHTGNYAWQVGATWGPGRVFSPARQQQRYRLSAWVMTTSGFGSGHLVLSVNRANGTSVNTVANCYKSGDFGNTNGEWKYVEVILDLSAARNSLLTSSFTVPPTEQLQLSAYSYSDNAGQYLIDDIRFQPVESTATTYTHTPNVGLTSKSGANGQPEFYEFDSLERLKLVRDQDKNITKQLQYNYR